MTQIIHRRRAWKGGRVATGTQELTWRRVPRVNLTSQRREGIVTPPVVGLAVLLALAASVAIFFYMQLSSTNTEAASVATALDDLSTQISLDEGSLQTLEEEIAGVQQQMEELAEISDPIADALLELQAGRIDWGYAIDALLGVDGPDIKVKKVVVEPPAKFVVTLSAGGVVAIGKFQEYMRTVEDVLDLGLWSTEPAESGFVITAQVQVR